MTRVEKLIALGCVVGIVDIILRFVGPQHSPTVKGMEFIETAHAQAPIIGVSLLPKYVVTTNQSGDVIYVWEDQGRGYEARKYVAPR